MKQKTKIPFLTLSLLFIVLTFQIGIGQAVGNQLIVDAPSTAEIKKEPALSDPTIVRSRNVIVNQDILHTDDIIELDLFGDVSFSIKKQRIQNRGPGRFTWFGSVKGQKDSQVILTVENGGMAGNITVDNQMYQIRDSGSGIHSVREIDLNGFGDCFAPTPVDVKHFETEPIKDSKMDDGSIIDIMVVYTAAAAASAGILSEIQLAIDETNQSYINSGVTPRLNLVHSAQVTYTESGDIQTDRNRLQSKTDGYMDNVHALRDTHKADLVSLWVANGGGYCGIAYIMTTVSTAFEDYGFQVTARNCATGYFSFGHEFGHIQSARHDWYVDPTNNSPYTYNHGYVDPADAWRTIMAYGNDCAGCTRIQYWSNPNVQYGGKAMGIAEGQPQAADNRKTLNNTAATVANFRQSANAFTIDIKANSSDGPVTISQSEPLSIAINLNAAGNTDNADWWVLGNTPMGWYRFAVPGGWGPGISVTHQGPLFDLASYTVLNATGLPLGDYTFYFGVDTVMNGSLDLGQMTYDSVNVSIANAASAVGTWSMNYDWDCDGNDGNTTWYINSNGTFTTSSSYSGTWTQVGDQVTLVYTSGTTYTGTINPAADSMSGTMISHLSATGCWTANRTTPDMQSFPVKGSPDSAGN